MNIEEMEKQGIADYYLELKEYIQHFVDKNYPIAKEDMSSIVNDKPNDKVIKRQEVVKLLQTVMEEELQRIAEKNQKMMDKASEGEYTPFSEEDYRQEIIAIKERMMERLWKEEHKDTDFER